MRFALMLVLGSFLLLPACSAPSNAAVDEAAVVTAASDSELVPFLTSEQANARARSYESRHPGWKVVAVGELTGGMFYASVDRAPGPPVSLSNDELVQRARDFLLPDLDLHAVAAAELSPHFTDGKLDASGFGANVYDDGGRKFVSFFGHTHPTGFEGERFLGGWLTLNVFFDTDGVPWKVRVNAGNTDERGLPSGIQLHIGKTPKLPANDPQLVANILGRNLVAIEFPNGHAVHLPATRPVDGADVKKLAPMVYVDKSEALNGWRLTVAYMVTVTMPVTDPTAPSRPRTANFYFVVDGATGAVLDTPVTDGPRRSA